MAGSGDKQSEEGSELSTVEIHSLGGWKKGRRGEGEKGRREAGRELMYLPPLGNRTRNSLYLNSPRGSYCFCNAPESPRR